MGLRTFFTRYAFSLVLLAGMAAGASGQVWHQPLSNTTYAWSGYYYPGSVPNTYYWSYPFGYRTYPYGYYSWGRPYYYPPYYGGYYFYGSPHYRFHHRADFDRFRHERFEHGFRPGSRDHRGMEHGRSGPRHLSPGHSGGAHGGGHGGHGGK
jgi:hypothetical protein